MKQINNDAEFRQALQALDSLQQRKVAAIFVEHVLHLSVDKRLGRVIKTAADTAASTDELLSSLNTAKSATLDSHARCGADGHWADQAGYFVARAAVAATTSPEHSRSGGPAWQAAMSARMAHTSILIDDVNEQQSAGTECEWQYQSLSDFLNQQA